MNSSGRSRIVGLLRRQWAGLLALFLVIAGGTAYAANTIGSTDIINGQVKSVDIGTGQVQSVDVKDDGLSSADLAADARGARAYGYVDGANCPDAVSLCTVTRTKRLDYAVHVAGGNWCVGINGISAADASSLAVVTPDAGTGTSWAKWRQDNSLCVAAEFEIQTGSNAGPGDVSFSIVIP